MEEVDRMNQLTVKDMINKLSVYMKDLPVLLLNRTKNVEKGVESTEDGFIRNFRIRGAYNDETRSCIVIEFYEDDK